MPDYYDREGKPMTREQWMQRFGDFDYKRVAHDEVGDDEVSTVWLGLDHAWGHGPPLIFETMIFRGEHGEDQWRYSTKEAARSGHDRVVTALREGRDPDGE